MVCPFRISRQTTKTGTGEVTNEYFMMCEGKDCPFWETYKPLNKNEEIEFCNRVERWHGK